MAPSLADSDWKSWFPFQHPPPDFSCVEGPDLELPEDSLLVSGFDDNTAHVSTSSAADLGTSTGNCGELDLVDSFFIDDDIFSYVPPSSATYTAGAYEQTCMQAVKLPPDVAREDDLATATIIASNRVADGRLSTSASGAVAVLGCAEPLQPLVRGNEIFSCVAGVERQPMGAVPLLPTVASPSPANSTAPGGVGCRPTDSLVTVAPPPAIMPTTSVLPSSPSASNGVAAVPSQPPPSPACGLSTPQETGLSSGAASSNRHVAVMDASPLPMECIDMTSSDTVNGQTTQLEAGPQKSAEEDDEKRQVRMQRNRESAQLSRQRKKMQMEEFERHNSELAQQNKYLQGLVSQLTAENACLRHQLVTVCQATNTPLPAVGAAAQQGAAVGSSGGGGPAVPYYNYPGMPMFGYTPKVPIQKLPPTRVTPAAPDKAAGKSCCGSKSSSKRGGSSSASSVVKKGKAVTGTAMLAMVTLFAFTGHLSGWWTPVPPATQIRSRQLVQVAGPLPAINASAAQVLDDFVSDTATVGSSKELDVAQNDTITRAASGTATQAPRNSSSSGNSSSWSLLPDQTPLLLPVSHTRQQERAALQRLMDASHVALVWDEAWSSSPLLPELVADWSTFPALLASAVRAEGIINPIGCEKVFEVDALALPEHGKLKRKMNSYLSSLAGFKGPAVPLPPPQNESAQESESAQQYEILDEEDKPRIGEEREDVQRSGGMHKGDVLVSVVLPVKKDAMRSPGVATAVDRIFVVVLQQSAVYATYSCQLPKLGFGF